MQRWLCCVSADGEAAVAADVVVLVEVRVARVWYSHSGALLRELRSCLTDFKRYLAGLARSIRAAAADMASTLVHPRYHPTLTPRTHSETL